jgi:GTPase SAR1 family protein
MGGCCVADRLAVTEQERNETIDTVEAERFKRDKNVIKLLLLGGGGSGKSTIFKQILDIHGQTVEEHERELYIPFIAENVINSMIALVKQSIELSKTHPEWDTAISDSSASSRKFFLSLKENAGLEITLEIANHIKILWADRGIKNTFEKADLCLHQIADCADYFFDKIEEIVDDGYKPTFADLVRIRLRTTGIIESEFDVNDIKIKMIDVGGQKNERRKWIHAFDKVNGVLFIVALNGYDQCCFEDSSKNRLIESLEIFEHLLETECFKKTPFILFLNKTDLFRKAITRVSLSKLFPGYSGPMEYEQSLLFIRSKFEDIAKKHDKVLYVHATCATDRDHIRLVFGDVKDYILSESLKDMGFL